MGWFYFGVILALAGLLCLGGAVFVQSRRAQRRPATPPPTMTTFPSLL